MSFPVFRLLIIFLHSLFAMFSSLINFNSLSKQGTIEDHHPESSMEGAIYETDGAESTRPGHLKDGRIKIKEEQDSTDLADIPTLATASNTTKGKGTEKRKATIVSLSPGDDNEDEDEDEDEDDDDNGETGNGSDNKDTTAGQPSLSRRGRSSKVTKSQLAQKSESVRAKQPTRKPPGRPSKNAAAVSSSVNRKRSTTMKADKVESPRRSLRAAAESASINIAEQSVSDFPRIITQ
ncbi:hypothetical protein F5B20DRAFT_552057 [Whalleya microplaca]|nr:hypothetical protein F5B20DRAFT_552057 [Whalleya microplaca]